MRPSRAAQRERWRWRFSSRPRSAEAGARAGSTGGSAAYYTLGPVPLPTTPLATVDLVIELPGGRIVLVERRFPPLGWALPGGFVDVGETLGHAAVREAQEETGLAVELLEQLFTYSAPARDPRKHTVSTVFLARATGEPRGGDDAAQAAGFALDALPRPLCFDHARIVADYLRFRRDGARPRPAEGVETGGYKPPPAAGPPPRGVHLTSRTGRRSKARDRPGLRRTGCPGAS